MSAASSDRGSPGSARSDRFHLWRSRKDKVARWIIATGGVAVILTIGLIFFYLLWVVAPLFLPADSEYRTTNPHPSWARSPAVWVAIEEQQRIGLRVGADGQADFFEVANGARVQSNTLPLAPGATISRIAEPPAGEGIAAYSTDAGQVHVFQHAYRTDYSEGVADRKVVPELRFPYGEQPLFGRSASSLADLAISDSDKQLLIATLDTAGEVQLFFAHKRENLLTGEVVLDPAVSAQRLEIPVAPNGLSGMATAAGISGDHRWLYAGDTLGRLHRFSLPELQHLDSLRVSDSAISELSMLLGGISVLAGDAGGGISQSFPVRNENGEFSLQLVRRFEPLASSISHIIAESRRKGFLAIDENGTAGIYHTTAGQKVLGAELRNFKPVAAALSPRADGLLIEAEDGSLGLLEIDNKHPEVSFDSLWRKVWYENYTEPEHVWQSSAATNDFEPKFSLTPLVFGTLKAALYAMLFAIPLALMGAAYTAYFMSPGLRKIVKPTIEIMAALPTVILGFLAGLWFAPFVEEHLAGIFMILLVLPPGLLLFAWAWHRYAGQAKYLVREGNEPLLILPVLVGLGLLAMWLAEPIQIMFFEGDLRGWLTQKAGIDYDQRNALVVGCAMGFAVIPTIFSIAEDAIFGVPTSLADGSLALGATPWQTLTRVVLPTASPGIFSGLMIGLGRAVGETMIVLMATGNTPVMDWNIFEGMRTLAANIAVEMPESEVNSSHYRVLFLAALVLFIFTFIVNTGAEIVRQRLREKYSNL